ncbi:hypothetical protein [Pseudoalteromonas luteoviolacea]|uniref:hypothetical protein n=1 Tax=Pseudoalteromonas luteoviolacea TaxID=43657 RepID=UPI001B38206B|nr:hypothetical protein [Pseudoalteromonas luteoviolacea]MBQ4836030.1 hypothetical protein [Pseudoalteromonas luteoviolacea]
MPISQTEINNIKAPYFIVADCRAGKRTGQPKKEKPSKVIGYSSCDPLGVGFVTVYFEGGGWLLVQHLMRNHSIVNENWPTSIRTQGE